MSKSYSIRRVTAPVLVALIVLFSLVPAFSSGVVTPVDVRLEPSLTAGQNAIVDVTLSEPGPVVLTSSPAGVVSYSTTITSTSATLSVPVSAGASGPVTVILTSSGAGLETDSAFIQEEGQGGQGN